MDFVRPVEAVVPGAQGRVLAVLVQTTAELNLRTVAQLAGISQAQASRVLPYLVSLGVIERREIPPSSLFRLVPEHIASQALLRLARSRDIVLQEMGRLAKELPNPPASVIVFGSFARGEADIDSDIDVVVVRPDGIEEQDDIWPGAIQRWREDVGQLSGNLVQVIEVSAHVAATKLTGRSQLWRDIQRDGQVVHGLTIEELKAMHFG